MNSPPEIPLLIEQAKQFLKSRQFNEAISLFQQAIAQDPYNVKLHESLASAYILAKEFDLAVEQLERILRISPQNVNAMINLGAMYNKVGNHAQAADILRRGLSAAARLATLPRLGLGLHLVEQSRCADSLCHRLQGSLPTRAMQPRRGDKAPAHARPSGALGQRSAPGMNRKPDSCNATGSW